MERKRTGIRVDKNDYNEAKIKMLKTFGEDTMVKLFRILLNKYVEGEVKISEEDWEKGKGL